MNIQVHPKENYSGRCNLKKQALVVSILNKEEKAIISLPVRLVKDQAQIICHSDLDTKTLTAQVMLHMPSNFLSYLYQNDLNLISSVADMFQAILNYEDRQS